MKLSETSLSIRAINCLRALEILTVEDLKDYVSQEPVESLLKYNHIGNRTLDEIKSFIKSDGVDKCCSNCIRQIQQQCNLIKFCSMNVNLDTFYCCNFSKK